MLEAPDLLKQFSSQLVKDNVDIITFAESPDYCNKPLYPRQRTLLKIIFLQDLDDYDRKVIEEWYSESGEVTLVPKLYERIDYLKANGYKHFRTVQFVGGRRSSKGFLTGLCIAYKLYQLVQMENPAAHYGIQKGKDIYFSVVADSLQQAKDHQFGDATNWLFECTPLIEQQLLNKALAETTSVYTPYDKRRLQSLMASGLKPDRDMASLKVKAFGTNSKTIRGSASMMFVFDEMAHLISGESRMSDEELYKASIPSLAQFHKDAMIFANSSPYTKTGKFFELYNQAIELEDKENPDSAPKYPDHFMMQFPSWELYKDKHLSEFYAHVEPPAADPKESEIMRREELQDPDSFKVEYRAQFAEVVDAFLRPEMVDRMFSIDWNKQTLGRVLIPQEGAMGFMRYSGHADPSKENANFGIAIGHLETVKNAETGIEEPHVVFDFIDAFYPADFEDGEIDWMEVVPTIVDLINRYRPFQFTFDQFNSAMPIQQIRKDLMGMGIGDTVVDEKTATHEGNRKRAMNFRQALNLGRIHAPHPDTYNPEAKHNPIELAKLELKFLQEKNGKVDRQTIGPVKTKDIADCLMEVTDALIGNTIMGYADALENSRAALGAKGGYNYGNTDTFEDVFGGWNGWYPTTGRDRGMGYAMPERGIRRPRNR